MFRKYNKDKNNKNHKRPAASLTDFPITVWKSMVEQGLDRRDLARLSRTCKKLNRYMNYNSYLFRQAKDVLVNYERPIKKSLKLYDPGFGPMHELICLKTGELVCTYSASVKDQAIYIFNPYTGALTNTIGNPHTSKIKFLQPLLNNSFASISNAYEIKIWDVDSKECLRTIVGADTNGNQCITAVCSLPSGELVTALQLFEPGDNQIVLWDIKTGRHLTLFGKSQEKIRQMIALDHDRILTISDRNQVCLWNIKSGTKIDEQRPFEITSYMNMTKISENHIVFYSNGWMQIHDISTNHIARHEDRAYYDSDGFKRILSLGNDRLLIQMDHQIYLQMLHNQSVRLVIDQKDAIKKCVVLNNGDIAHASYKTGTFQISRFKFLKHQHMKFEISAHLDKHEHEAHKKCVIF